MFQNIGKKIKTLAVVVCWIGIAGSVIGGIVMCAVGADSSGGDLLIGLGIPAHLLRTSVLMDRKLCSVRLRRHDYPYPEN